MAGKKNGWGDIEPDELRRACSVMACGDGWKSFVASRVGDKWIFKERDIPLTAAQRDEGYVLIDRDDFYSLSVEYGYGRLNSLFGSAALSPPPY